MAEEKKEIPDDEELNAVPRLLERWKIFGHVLLQMALVVAIFFQVNYISCKRFKTWDITEDNKFTLQQTTVDVLKGLESEVKIVMAYLGGSETFVDAKSLLNQYDQAGGNRIAIEVLDLSRNKERLAELRNQYDLEFYREQIVLLADGDRKKTINAEELVRRDPATQRVKDFLGEEILTSAILEVTEKQKRKIYLVAGDREVEPIMQIGGQLQRYAATQNALVETFVLDGASAIPADAEALIFAGNNADVSERELELVKDFWLKKKGGLLIFLDPAADVPNLSSLLRSHGVIPNNDRIIKVEKLPGLPLRKSFGVTVAMNRNFVPLSKGPNIPSMSTVFSSQSQSLDVRYNDPIVRGKNIWPTPLMEAIRGFYGETEYESENVAFDETQDNGAPVFVGASIVVGEPGDAELKKETSRLIVVGNPDVIDPSGNTSKDAADFVMASLNWVINREALSGIAPRAPSDFTLSITPSQAGNLKVATIFVLPMLALIMGAVVWWRRRA